MGCSRLLCSLFLVLLPVQTTAKKTAEDLSGRKKISIPAVNGFFSPRYLFWSPGHLALRRWNLAFTRDFHHQHRMVYIAIKWGRGETIYCAIVCAVKGGSGVPKQRWHWQIASLIRAHTPQSKTISCKGQAGTCRSVLSVFGVRI